MIAFTAVPGFPPSEPALHPKWGKSRNVLDDGLAQAARSEMLRRADDRLLEIGMLK
jgi:hypothetical protein